MTARLSTCRALPTALAAAAMRGPGTAASVAPSASTSAAPHPWRVLKKSEQMDFSNCVCRIMTNKRGNWQSTGRG